MILTLRYEDLEQGHVDRLLADGGELRVELPERHAIPLAALLSLVRKTRDWRHEPFLRRFGSAARGLALTVRILIFNNKLLSLLNVIVLNSTAQTWHTRPDGMTVFQFKSVRTEA